MGTIIVLDQNTSPSISYFLNTEEHLVDSGPVEYPCEASGRPAPTITWYYNGEVVQSGSDGVVVSGNGSSLTIPAPQVSHSGIYQCFARNLFGEDSRVWILYVRTPVIEIVDIESSLEITGRFLPAPLGTTNLVITVLLESSTIRDVVTCDSCPAVQWQINGTNISSGEDYTVSDPCSEDSSSPYTFTLTIASLTPETSGEYSATFSLLGVMNSVRLNVALAVAPENINFLISPSPTVGRTLELQCRVGGSPMPDITWTKDSKSLLGNGRHNIFTQEGMAALRIDSAILEDSGVYTCTASNVGGSTRSSVTLQLSNSTGSTGAVVGGVVGGFVALAVTLATGIAMFIIGMRIEARHHEYKGNKEVEMQQNEVYGLNISQKPQASADQVYERVQ